MAIKPADQATYFQFRIDSHRGEGDRTHWVKADKQDADLISANLWHVIYDGRSYYARSAANITLGRLILGDTELGDMHRVDYINGNTLDCRRANLRYVTQEQIMAKRRPSGGSSRYKGVTWDAEQGKWLATFRGRKIGRFLDEIDAARAFDEAAFDHWGSEAYLNFPVRMHTAPMTGARARLLQFAADACLDTTDAAASPTLATLLRQVRNVVDEWACLPPEWVEHRQRAALGN